MTFELSDLSFFLNTSTDVAEHHYSTLNTTTPKFKEHMDRQYNYNFTIHVEISRKIYEILSDSKFQDSTF